MLRSQRAVVAAVLSAVVFTACGHGDGGPQGPPPLAVDVAKAQRQTSERISRSTGRSRRFNSRPSRRRIRRRHRGLRERRSARLSGQLLAKLDDSTLRAQLAQQMRSPRKRRPS